MTYTSGTSPAVIDVDRAVAVTITWEDGHVSRRKLDNRVIVVFLVLAAPVLAALLFWGSWGWLVAAVAVAVVEYVTLRRSQRFSARLWRSVRLGRRSSHERAAETIYAVSAVAGVLLFIVAVVAAL